MKISLITASYNNAHRLAPSLISSLQQTYSSVERIIIDGASTDDTSKTLEKYKPYLDKIVSEPDQGIYDALNKGIRMASGDIVGILHSDDYFADESVLNQVAKKFNQSDADFLYGDLCYVRPDKPSQVVRYWKSGGFTRSSLTRGWMPPHPTVYVRRELFNVFKGYNLHYQISADYDWILRLLCNESLKVVYLPKVLVHMRTGGVSNQSFKNLMRKSSEDWEIIRNHQIGGIRTLFYKNLRKFPQFWTSR